MPEGKYRGDRDDQDKGKEDILRYGGENIEHYGGTIKAKFKGIVNGEGTSGVISGRIRGKPRGIEKTLGTGPSRS